ncbi:hypothetical protein C5O80_05750 [Burkholderia sp. SRS-46]|nr:hypothetical protein C5O80_05750 [Burkholderia sp. SRS-46]
MDQQTKQKVDAVHAEVKALPVYIKGPGGKVFAALLDVIDHLAKRVGQLEQTSIDRDFSR